MDKTKVQIAREIEQLCIEKCVETGNINIAETIYEYIDENREFLECNNHFPLEDEDEYAEEIAILIDEDTIYEQAVEIKKTRVY